MNTLRQTLDITLLDDCVFSERAATEGAHDTLDRIPGSALLGAAAAQLYAQLSPDQAYAVFHSGRLRFGDGLPATHGGVAWPVPMCWHYDKNHKPKDSLEGPSVFNLLQSGSDSQQPKIQFKQLREGYVSASGRWIKPTRNYRMKTAISPATGRAAEAQLFGYSALQRGQRFIAQIEADADFDPTLFARITQVLQGQLFLGRSRSAEYGRVRIEHRTREHAEQPGPVNGSMLTLWLLSDLAPCNAHGQPTLELDVAGLGLPAGSRIDWAKTFTRSRRYSPWNAKRHGFDSERQVLMAGGVIHIELPEGADTPALTAQLSRGIGLHREAGLGRVWVNPPLLATEHPAFGAPQAAAVTQPPAVPRPDHPLIEWLSRQTSTSREAIDARVHEITEEYHKAIAAARREKGYPNYATDFYPSRSQWGSVLEAARARDGQDLYRALFEGNDAIIKRTGKGWNLEVRPPQGRSQRDPLADWLKHYLADPSAQTCDARLVQQLARRLMDDITKQELKP
jgi:hypothetical protein